MGDLNFTEEDKQKTMEFLNMVFKHAKFKVNSAEIIQYFKLLAHMQQKIVPKIEANILEVKQVIQPEEPKEIPKAKGKK